MNKNNIQKLLKTLVVTPHNEDLYHEALTHRSFVNEVQEDVTNNERLEFLGDAVLELVTTEFLFKTYPEHPEGDLTSFRAAVVRTESLAAEASRLKLGEFIYMSKGEEATGGRERQYILANTFEAIIGALYLDLGYKTAEEFIITNVCYKLDEVVKNRLDIDAKSKLQEISQEIVRITPSYELIKEQGPDHSKTFEMAVVIGEHTFATGKGKSKQEAEQNAAQKALGEWQELVVQYFPQLS